MLPGTLVGCSSKSYFDLASARHWGQRVAAAVEAGEVSDVGLYVCPAFPLVPVLAGELTATDVALGAQDVSVHPPGAFTGEVSAELLAELGVRYVMVGHPERLRMSDEEAKAVPGKIERVAQAGLVPIIIVGEPEPGPRAEQRWAEQLEMGLARFPRDGELVVAYEPTWAIGQAEPASGEHIVEAVASIRSLAGQHVAETRVLYGGSARPGTFTDIANAAAARGMPVPEGIFLGRAGLDPAAFLATAAEVQSARAGAVDAADRGGR